MDPIFLCYEAASVVHNQLAAAFLAFEGRYHMGWVFFFKDTMLVDALMSHMVPSIIDTWLRTKYSPLVASVSNRLC